MSFDSMKIWQALSCDFEQLLQLCFVPSLAGVGKRDNNSKEVRLQTF
ncbi:hypothetical protein [Paenibacillus lemnae]|nr:hypothetical protein [Paenibacillus lemnae]